MVADDVICIGQQFCKEGEFVDQDAGRGGYCLPIAHAYKNLELGSYMTLYVRSMVTRSQLVSYPVCPLTISVFSATYPSVV